MEEKIEVFEMDPSLPHRFESILKTKSFIYSFVISMKCSETTQAKLLYMQTCMYVCVGKGMRIL